MIKHSGKEHLMNPMTSSLLVGFFHTCLVDSIKPNIGLAAIKLIEMAGCRVAVPENQTCCGRPAFNSGDRRLSREIAQQVIGQFEAYDYVVGPSGSCMSMLINHYPMLLSDNRQWHNRALALAEKSFELTDFLVNVVALPQLPRAYPGTVTFHDTCSGLRELGIKEQPRILLSGVRGLKLKEMAGAESCCGFGGTFSVKYPEISVRMVDDKIRSILATGADTVSGIDLGCLMNIHGRLNRLKINKKVFHIAEILAGMTSDGPLGTPEGSGER